MEIEDELAENRQNNNNNNSSNNPNIPQTRQECSNVCSLKLKGIFYDILNRIRQYCSAGTDSVLDGMVFALSSLTHAVLDSNETIVADVQICVELIDTFIQCGQFTMNVEKDKRRHLTLKRLVSHFIKQSISIVKANAQLSPRLVKIYSDICEGLISLNRVEFYGFGSNRILLYFLNQLSNELKISCLGLIPSWKSLLLAEIECTEKSYKMNICRLSDYVQRLHWSCVVTPPIYDCDEYTLLPNLWNPDHEAANQSNVDQKWHQLLGQRKKIEAYCRNFQAVAIILRQFKHEFIKFFSQYGIKLDMKSTDNNNITTIITTMVEKMVETTTSKVKMHHHNDKDTKGNNPNNNSRNNNKTKDSS